MIFAACWPFYYCEMGQLFPSDAPSPLYLNIRSASLTDSLYEPAVVSVPDRTVLQRQLNVPLGERRRNVPSWHVAFCFI